MNAKQYESLSRDELVRRCMAAETFAIIWGWTDRGGFEDEGKARHQLYSDWAGEVGQDWIGPRLHPELNDPLFIPGLAARRDAIRERTLAAIRPLIGKG